jgi:RNA polymerase sigma-70 factor (ECF subfamily)
VHAPAGLIVRLALVNGAPGVVSWLADGRPFSVMGFAVARGRIVGIDVLTNPAGLRRLDLSAFRT